MAMKGETDRQELLWNDTIKPVTRVIYEVFRHSIVPLRLFLRHTQTGTFRMAVLIDGSTLSSKQVTT